MVGSGQWLYKPRQEQAIKLVCPDRCIRSTFGGLRDCHGKQQDSIMTLHIELAPVLSIAAGIAILVAPKLLNYIVAAYLIVVGLLQIVN